MPQLLGLALAGQRLRDFVYVNFGFVYNTSSSVQLVALANWRWPVAVPLRASRCPTCTSTSAEVSRLRLSSLPQCELQLALTREQPLRGCGASGGCVVYYSESTLN